MYTCRLCIVPLVGGGVGCWQPREGPAAVVLRLPPGHRAETQAPDGGGRRFHQGGREGTHPRALHGILQGTHPHVLGVYQGTLYVVLHTLYTSRVMRHSYTQL